MKKLLVFGMLAAFAAFAWLSLPHPTPPQDAGHVDAPGELADGVVLAVDKITRNLTISHGPLQSLGMPPMTMVFQVDDAATLERVKAGDRVKFHADAAGGALIATKIELVK